MTCIVGIAAEGKVYIGGDSLSSSGYNREIRTDEKVFIKGEFLFGFTSSWRMGHLLQYSLTAPDRKEGISDHEYLSTAFIDAVRDCLKAGGYARKKEEEESAGVFLLGYRGTLYKVDSDYQVAIPARKYAAVGAGEDYALGALDATARIARQMPIVRSPDIWLLWALEAAGELCAFVAPPFIIKSV